MQIDEDEKKDIKTFMLIDGYKTYETDYFNSNSYKSLRNIMLECLPYGDMGRFHFDYISKSEVISSGKYVIDKHFCNLDLRVRYSRDDDMKSRLMALFGSNPKPDKYEEIINYVNNQIDLVRVTDIPVYLNCNNNTNGYVATSYFYGTRDMEEEYFRNLPNCVREIGLEGNCTEDTKCVYVHEMAHALIDRYKGNINNLLNNEAFSIFMEKVAAKDLDESGELLGLKHLYRILQTKHNVLEKEMIEFNEGNLKNLIVNQKYIISTLHATALFHTYSKGSIKLKNEIDFSLGKVIMGEDILEDVLKRYEATLDKGSRIMKRQIKKYHSEIEKKM